MAIFSACAIFLGAWLLFLVQPMMGKMILPWFGGTPAVWTTCMLFFQLLLLAGYAYAALLIRVRGLLKQVTIHLGLLTLGVCLLPVTPGVQWKPVDGQQPVLRILMLLTVCVGWPYFLLSATSPLVQSWFGRAFPSRSPYRLYALSNTGSLGALLAYPFLIEPTIATSNQGLLWSAAYGLFVLLCGGLFWHIRQLKRDPSANSQLPAVPASDSVVDSKATSPTWSQRGLWLTLSGLASTMLLAVTNHLCQDVAVVPFLWIVPLSLYLISLIICFERDRWYVSSLYSLLGMIAILIASDLAFVTYMGSGAEALGNNLLTALRFNIVFVISVYLAIFFCVCMVCHGEIVRRRPAPQYLTEFYLMISAGGALGGVVVALICPAIFSTYLEMNIGLVVCFALCALVFLRDAVRIPWLAPSSVVVQATKHAVASATRLTRSRSKSTMAKSTRDTATKTRESRRLVDTLRQSRMLQRVVVGLCGLLLMVVIISQTLSHESSSTVLNLRNFYGVLSVREWSPEHSEFHGRAMYHGAIMHGYQFLDEGRQNEPTTYYTANSGIGLTFAALRQDLASGVRRSLNVGAIGLGIGTVAAYGEAGDKFRFYEINPQVIQLAQSSFRFLSGSKAAIAIVPGDARLTLERETPNDFDLMIVDAFSGDAIPVHLLTRQAIDIYLQHMKAGGLIALHISNRHVDLRRVIRRLAADRDLYMAEFNQVGMDVMNAWPSEWIVLARSPSDLAQPPIRDYAFVPPANEGFPVWTDDTNNLFEVLHLW